jgi:hypothetical protein
MPLTAGAKLGPYEIQSPLGAGGMGEVYRAKDTRLDRTVAIKVLPSHLSNDPELKQRMEREAKAISALQHANICTLYDIGMQDGINFLVMEYLEGQTLADRLAKGALSGLLTGNQTIWSLPLGGERKPHLVAEHAINGALSPNGRWLAYTLFSGEDEIYVVAYGGGQGKWQVSPSGGQVPQWSKDGKELYYFDGTQSISAIPVKDMGNTLEFGASQTLVNQWTILTQPFYSVSPDGEKLLMERVSQQVSEPLTVVTNYTAQLRK